MKLVNTIAMSALIVFAFVIGYSSGLKTLSTTQPNQNIDITSKLLTNILELQADIDRVEKNIDIIDTTLRADIIDIHLEIEQVRRLARPSTIND